METGRESDEWLMTQVARGDRSPLGVLLRHYVNSLFTFIRRMTGDHHRSEDIFQEVFLAVWTQSRSYVYPRSFKLRGFQAGQSARNRSAAPARSVQFVEAGAACASCWKNPSARRRSERGEFARRANGTSDSACAPRRCHAHVA